MAVRFMPSVVFVMVLKGIEYIRGCRRRLHVLTVARVVVIDRTVTVEVARRF